MDSFNSNYQSHTSIKLKIVMFEIRVVSLCAMLFFVTVFVITTGCFYSMLCLFFIYLFHDEII